MQWQSSSFDSRSISLLSPSWARRRGRHVVRRLHQLGELLDDERADGRVNQKGVAIQL